MSSPLNSQTRFLCLFTVLVSICCSSCTESGRESEAFISGLIHKLDSSRVMLPNGWQLSPAGHSIRLGDLPMNLVVSVSGKYMAVTNNGQSRQSIILIDPAHEKILDDVAIGKSWYGLAFNAAETRLYASGGNDNRIIVYDVSEGRLQKTDSIALGKPWPVRISPTGIAFSNKTNTIFAATKEDSALYAADMINRKVRKLKLGSEVYACILSPDATSLYASLWGDKKVAVIDPVQLTLRSTIDVGDHPNEMTMTRDGKYLFVAQANDNSVSVIETASQKVIEVYTSSVVQGSLEGSTPNAIALSADENNLYIANADNNCLAVFDVRKPGEGKSLGFVPTGWYPTSVKVWGNKLWVTNGKGFQSLPNPRGPNPYKTSTDSTQYIGSLFQGTLSIIDEPGKTALDAYTQAVFKNTPYSKEIEKQAEGVSGNPIPRSVDGSSPIRYVFYIIKENRTYDQVFGDLVSGNGDSSLCLFPERVTPNQHALARSFVLLDNFYVNAEVSADGHNWSMGAYANDYVEKTWPTSYGDRGGTYDYEGSRKIAYPAAGFLWDDCARNGVSFRNYGEFINDGKASMKSLEGHFDPDFPSFDLDITDMERFRIWKQDFDSLVAAAALPSLSIIRLPNDHTAGARAGAPTPRAMVAENDEAVGALVEHISKSSVWKESAIFILEDDAQSGPDHVDAHRSNILVISPYVKRLKTVSRLYSTASVLRTMELILGLPPMSQFDAAATPLWECFTSDPDPAPYKALRPSYNIHEINPARTALAEEGKDFDLTIEDAVPDLQFSEVIWKAIRGVNSPMPAPVRSAFIIPVEGDEEDD